MAFSPMVTPPKGRARTDRSALLDQSVLNTPISFRLKLSCRGGRAGIPVVDESYTMPDENLGLKRHFLANEGMA
jgi:hypothetical protein